MPGRIDTCTKTKRTSRGVTTWEMKGCPAIHFRVNRKLGNLDKGELPEGQPETIRIVPQGQTG